MRGTLIGSNGDLDIHAIDLKIRSKPPSTPLAALKAAQNSRISTSTVDLIAPKTMVSPSFMMLCQSPARYGSGAHAYVGPPGDGFMERRRMSRRAQRAGREVVGSRYGRERISAFSERALGNDKPGTINDSHNKSADATKDVLSSLQGAVKIENGVVSTSRLTFKVPGAQAVWLSIPIRRRSGAPCRVMDTWLLTPPLALNHSCLNRSHRSSRRTAGMMVAAVTRTPQFFCQSRRIFPTANKQPSC